MALTYTQDHNWWVQRVNKEILASSRFNMYNSQSLFKSTRKASEQSIKKLSRPSTAKSVGLSQKSIPQNALSRPAVSPLVPAQTIKSPEPDIKTQTDIRPLSSRLSARSLKGKVKTSNVLIRRNSGKIPEDARSNLSQKSNPSVKSLAPQSNSNTLKSYIKELEDLLRQEKLKRIETEENLRKVLRRSD